MAKAYAINTVTICSKPGKRGPDGKVIDAAVLEDKLPGTIFECGEADFKAFLAAGAIREPTKAELAEAKTAEPERPAAPAA